MRVIVFLAFCVAAVAAVPMKPQRIVGGSLTTISEYPTMAACLVSFDLVNYRQSCGGTILNNRSVLTAAHCTIGDAANKWRFRVGSTYGNSGGVVHIVQLIINHPSYNSNSWDADISMLRSSTAIAHSNNVRPVPIAGINYNVDDNQAVWAAGWGLTSSGGSPSEQLRHVQVYTINQAICINRYGIAGVAITDTMVCSGVLDVGGRDQCTMDSGGPLYHNGVQIGVCSFGIGCGDPFYPSVNTRVSRFATWIQSNA